MAFYKCSKHNTTMVLRSISYKYGSKNKTIRYYACPVKDCRQAKPKKDG